MKITVQSGIECTIEHIRCYCSFSFFPTPCLSRAFALSSSSCLFFVISLARKYNKKFTRAGTSTQTQTHTQTRYANINWFILWLKWVIVNDPFWWLWFKVILSKIALQKRINIAIHIRKLCGCHSDYYCILFYFILSFSFYFYVCIYISIFCALVESWWIVWNSICCVIKVQ